MNKEGNPIRYQIQDSSGEVLGEFTDYDEAAEWLKHINDQHGPIAWLVFID